MKRILLFLAAFILILAVSGCKEEKKLSSDNDSSTLNTAPPMIDVEIDKLVTVQQVGSAMGFTVEKTDVSDQDTTVRYWSEDMMSFAEISMMECSREIFDVNVNIYEDAVDTPNLGQAAKWSAEHSQLLLYNGEYLITITASSDNKGDDQLLVSARQIAALVLEKL